MESIKMDLFKARHGDEVRDTESGSTTKPCLDKEGGLYRVDGGVTIEKIQYRSSNQSNIAPLIGYQVTKGHINEKGDWVPVETLCVSREEGLEIALAYNYKNAYVGKSVKKRREGNEISHFLRPHPAKSNSFTRDDAIVQAYEVDEFGSKVRPYELTLREDECSASFWALLEDDYDRKTRGHREQKSRKQAIKDQKVEQIKRDLRVGRHNIVNPYRNNLKEDVEEITTDVE